MVTFMRISLHREVKLVGVDLQAKHGLHVLASARNVVRRMAAQVHHVIEAMPNFLPQGIGEDTDECLRRAGLNGILRDGDHRSLLQPGGLEPRISGTFSGVMDTNHGFEEIGLF